MTSWMNEAAAVQNHNGNNAFSHMNDPNNLAGGPANMMDPAAFMGNPAQFNAAAAAGQFANPQQMAAAMQNGQMRNASPSFQAPVYQTNPVIPSKRPRPREDSIGASPRQNPGMLPTSRADTPQQSPFPGGFQPNGMPQAPPPQQHGVGQPPQYPHLQPNGSATASPSPVMAGNQLRPGSVPQRVNTASPHPFSPASQQFGPQASPVPSEHGGTPQPNPYMQNQNFPPGFNPNYAASPSPARTPSGQNPMAPQMMPQQMPQQMGQMGQMGQMQQMQQMHPGQMHPNQMAQMAQMQQMQQQMQQQMAAGRGGMDPAQQQKMLYQMRLQQMQHGNMQMAAQMQHPAQSIGQGRGMMPNKQPMPMPMANGGQMPAGGMNPQQAQMARANNPETFMKNLTQFMNLQGLPLDPNPSIEGRPLPLMQLFVVVGKFGSYRSVMARNLWGQVAGAVGFQPAQIPSAPAIIKAVYEKNLLRFEEAWRNKKGGTQPMGTSSPMPMGGGPSTPQRMGSQGQMPPGHSPMQPGMQPGQPQPMPPAQQTPMKTPAMPQPNINGFSTPQQNHMAQQPQSGPPSHMRNSLSRNVETPPVGDFPVPSPSMGKPGSMSMPAPNIPPEPIQNHGQAVTLPFPGHSASDPDEYVACSRELKDDGYGGIEPSNFCVLADQLEQWRPDIPPPMELGNIDIQALTKSLQCGIHGEVRLALDTLGSITHQAQNMPPLVLDLRFCDDLVESLVDCAEEQVDELAEATKPVSDEIDLPSYEEALRIRRYERFNLKKFAVFGEADSELEHAADRLIAVMTILRNLSFIDGNTPILADEAVVKFLCSAIRSLGTLENFLRTPSNTLDFMKDAIVFLSNIAGSIELPGRDHALCLLQFLLSFAPSPAPDVASGKILFAPFDPLLHPYLPLAVDALAKLLARDEPNRTHYKAIFAADASSSPACELLTRAFGLAICSIPDQNREDRPQSFPSLVETRKPALMQGLLAADILASLAPGHESGIAGMWLSSSEGFAQNLFRLIRTLCSQAEPAQAQTSARGANSRTQPREDQDVMHIINWGVSALKRLGEKARDPHNPSSIPPNALPTKESLFGALHSLKSPKWTVLLNQLSSYAGLED